MYQIDLILLILLQICYNYYFFVNFDAYFGVNFVIVIEAVVATSLLNGSGHFTKAYLLQSRHRHK